MSLFDDVQEQEREIDAILNGEEDVPFPLAMQGGEVVEVKPYRPVLLSEEELEQIPF